MILILILLYDSRLVTSSCSGVHITLTIVNSKNYANGSEKEKTYQAYLQDQGLSLIMFTGPADNHHNYLYDPATGGKGMIIRIEDVNYDGIFMTGVGVSAGYHAQIVLTRTETHSMPRPYSNCVPANLVDTKASRE